MQQADDMRDRFITEFAENYMEKLFYFCLKKTGDQFEAEDLTQAIEDFKNLGEKYGIDFVLSVSKDAQDLPKNANGRISVSL